jgi:hypothetical protein
MLRSLGRGVLLSFSFSQVRTSLLVIHKIDHTVLVNQADHLVVQLHPN